jgi:hypothetical protein
MKLTALFLLFPLLCSAQGHRWALEIRGADTMLVAPLQDMRIALAYRLTVDSMNVNYRLEIHERVDGAIKLNEALDKSITAHGKAVQQRDILRMQLTEKEAEVFKLSKVKEGRNTWRTITVITAAVLAASIAIK